MSSLLASRFLPFRFVALRVSAFALFTTAALIWSVFFVSSSAEARPGVEERTINRSRTLPAVGEYDRLSSIRHPGPALPGQGQIQNLQVFARLYGYVRYFHPSDAASATDWDRFAVYGARQVQQAETPGELRAVLEQLFRPIAPTVQLYATGEAPPDPAKVLVPRDTADLNLVAWQHRGLGLGNRGPYRSVRLNRPPPEGSEGSGFGTVAQSVDAAPYRGKQIKLQAAVRAEVEGRSNQAQLWLRVDRTEGNHGFFDNMADRPVTSPDWKTYEITGPVAEDARRIVLGGFLKGNGKAWFDDFRLLVRDGEQGDWSPVSLENPTFRKEGKEESLVGWGFGAPGYRASTVTANPFEGPRALRIQTSPSAAKGLASPLFEKRPEAGEVVTRPLGRGLSVQIPLALYSRDGQTLRPADAPAPERLRAQLEEVSLDTLTAEDEALRYGGVVIAWNVFQHFYPYFDVVDTDWHAVLTRTLRRAAEDETSEEFLLTLRRMVAQLEDGHGFVRHPLTKEKAGLPIRTDWTRGGVVVTAVADSLEEACIQRGDVVTAIDGEPMAEVLRTSKKYYSGTSRWKTDRALSRLAHGKRGTEVTLTLQRDDEEEVACTVARRAERRPSPERSRSITELREDIYYVNLSDAGPAAIRERMQALAGAQGVIFDLRGYPEGGNQAVLQHLTADTLHSAWWQVPQQIYPDQRNRVGYEESRWTLPPKEPRITGEVVFLTNSSAISYAESIMGIVEHYELGEIVGEPTAGANGNVNPFALPGGYRIHFTGMRVVKHDRSQHHLVGVRPTVPVQKTLEDVRAGRDPYLQKALTLIRSRKR